jgi:hypothetical protein
LVVANEWIFDANPSCARQATALADLPPEHP